MHFTTLLTTTAALLTTSLTTAAPTSTNLTSTFLIKTHVSANQSAALDRFNNLYLTPYHTGAGTNDAVLVANATDANAAYFNTTDPSTTYDNAYPLQFVGQSFAYGLDVVVGSYADWGFVEINAGNGQDVQLKDGELTWAYEQFREWMVCDWWHGEPQLFAVVDLLDIAIPVGCASVELLPVYA